MREMSQSRALLGASTNELQSTLTKTLDRSAQSTRLRTLIPTINSLRQSTHCRNMNESSESDIVEVDHGGGGVERGEDHPLSSSPASICWEPYRVRLFRTFFALKMVPSERQRLDLSQIMLNGVFKCLLHV